MSAVTSAPQPFIAQANRELSKSSHMSDKLFSGLFSAVDFGSERILILDFCTSCTFTFDLTVVWSNQFKVRLP